MQINPQSNNALFVRGLAKGSKRDYDGAIADFSQVISAVPDRAAAGYLRRGEMYEAKGNFDKAIVDYNKAVELDPKAAEAAGRLRARAEAAMKQKANTSVAKSSESELDKVLREENIVLSKEEKIENAKQSKQITKDIAGNPENTAKIVDAMKNMKPKPPEEYKMIELVFRKRDITRKFNAFKADYAKTSDVKQQLAMLNRIRTEYQTALTEVENAEKQNLNFSPEDKNWIAEYKAYCSQSIKVLDEMIDSRGR